VTVSEELRYRDEGPDQDLSLVDVHSATSCDHDPADAADPTLTRAEGNPGKSPGPPPRFRKRVQPIPIMIIDKSALFRAGLAHVLAGGRFRIAAGCSALYELPDSALKNGQCLMLLGLDGAEECGATFSHVASLKARGEKLRTVILAEQFRPHELLAAIEAGVDGYLIKDELTPEALVQTLEVVLLGGVVIPRGLNQMMKGWGPQLDAVPDLAEMASECAELQPPNDVAPSADAARLSQREQIILKQLTQGASNKHIARSLNIAEATVKVHVKSLLRKIRVNNRTQAAMWAIEHATALSSAVVFMGSLMDSIAV